MSFIVGAYYTRATFYEQEAKEMADSAAHFELPVEIRCYESRGSWIKNIAIKPEFIMAMLLAHPDKDLLYVDVDARFRQSPSFFADMDGDLGVHYRMNKKYAKKGELLSGTIFFRNNDRVRELVRKWADQQARRLAWDQRVLEEVIEDTAHPLGVKVVNIPPQYTQIYDTMRDCGDPVIEHLQASRRARRQGLTRKGVPGYVIIYTLQSVLRHLKAILAGRPKN